MYGMLIFNYALCCIYVAMGVTLTCLNTHSVTFLQHDKLPNLCGHAIALKLVNATVRYF